jgi:biopolymer transport protein ExbD
MVDIAFLLLIFYMVTTVFAAPQAMEVNLPEGPPIPYPEGRLLILRVDDEGKYWWTLGSDGPVQFSRDSLRTLLHDANRGMPLLSTLVVVHPDARYDDYVEILDEIEVAEHTLAMNDEFLKSYREANAGILDTAQTFSYRFATRPWNRDDRLELEKAKSSLLRGFDN